jgi:hypothetical protein
MKINLAIVAFFHLPSCLFEPSCLLSLKPHDKEQELLPLWSRTCTLPEFFSDTPRINSLFHNHTLENSSSVALHHAFHFHMANMPLTSQMAQELKVELPVPNSSSRVEWGSFI